MIKWHGSITKEAKQYAAKNVVDLLMLAMVTLPINIRVSQCARVVLRKKMVVVGSNYDSSLQ